MGSDSSISFIYLSEPDLLRVGVKDFESCIDTCEEVFKLVSKGDYIMGGAKHNEHGSVISFPDKPAFEGMPSNGPERRFIAMPAYVGGEFRMCGVKWYGSNVKNREKGLPRSILTLELNDPDTGAPVSFMSANLISAMRTGCVPAAFQPLVQSIFALIRRIAASLSAVARSIAQRYALCSVWNRPYLKLWSMRLIPRAPRNAARGLRNTLVSLP